LYASEGNADKASRGDLSGDSDGSEHSGDEDDQDDLDVKVNSTETLFPMSNDHRAYQENMRLAELIQRSFNTELQPTKLDFYQLEKQAHEEGDDEDDEGGEDDEEGGAEHDKATPETSDVKTKPEKKKLKVTSTCTMLLMLLSMLSALSLLGVDCFERSNKPQGDATVPLGYL